LAEMPAEAEWFKNIRNPSTKRAYENAISRNKPRDMRTIRK